MYISMKMIKDSLGLKSLKTQEAAVALTSLGLEVEGISSNKIDGLVVGLVTERVKHPESTKLSICQVDLGDLGTTQIVCGAKNVDAGQKVIVATVGAKLSPDFVIGVRKVVGVESAGMICSMSEIGQPQLQTYDGIYVIEDKNAKAGMKDPLASLFGIEYDDVIELSLTPNRSDCLGIYQILRELSAFYETQINFTIDRDYVQAKKIDFNVRISANDVTTFTVGEYDVVIKESDEKVSSLLDTAGIKTINNIVDATNYSMLLTGQPMHAFDAEKVKTGLIVTDGLEGTFIGLDDNEYKYDKTDIVIICNNEVAALAGIMGSKAHGVTVDTTKIIVEAANFNHIRIKNTAQRLNLYTQSATRFIKCLDSNNVFAGQNEFAKALGLKSNYKLVKGSIVPDLAITVSKEKVNSYFGQEPALTKVLRQLSMVGVNIKDTQDGYSATIDSLRIDITMDVNIIEEMVRFYGVENIEPLPPVQQVALYENEDNTNVVIEKIKNYLVSNHLNEVRTYSLLSQEKAQLFTDSKDFVKLAHPMSDERAVMRTSLIESLIDVVNYNKKRSVNDVAVFELAKTYEPTKVSPKLGIVVSGNYINTFKSATPMAWDFSLLKEKVALMFKNLNVDVEFEKGEWKDLHPGQTAFIIKDDQKIGVIGKVHPSYLQAKKLSDIFVCEIWNTDMKANEIKYEVVSNTNPITKDVTLLFTTDVAEQQIINNVEIVKDVINAKVVDIYRSEDLGKNNVSITIRFELDRFNHSFSSDEIELKLKEVIMSLHNELGGQHEWAN